MLTLLTENQVMQVSGSGINFGQIVSALAIGLVTGGPAGLGIAVSGLVLAQGVNNLDELLHNNH